MSFRFSSQRSFVSEGLQLASLFAPAFSYDFWHDLRLDTLDYFDWADVPYMTTFCFATLTITVFLVTYFVMMVITEGGDECCGVNFGTNGNEIFFGVFLLPILKALGHIFYCVGDPPTVYLDENILCWEGQHIGLVIWSIVALLIVFFGGWYRAVDSNPKAHNTKVYT